MIWNLIIDYVLQQLEINVKLISSYSMHHYMVAYLLDFKGMLITHKVFSVLLGIHALMSVRVHAHV